MPDTTAPSSTPSSFESLPQPAEATVVCRPEPVTVDDPVANAAYGPGNEPPKVTVAGETLKYVLSALILFGGIGVMVFLISLKGSPDNQDPSELIPKVRTVEATNYSGMLDKVISGTVVPYREIRVAAEVNGNVLTKFDAFEAGNFVQKGTKLLKIDPQDYHLQLEAGEAEVEQANRMLEEAEEEVKGAELSLKIAAEEFTLAEREFKRNEELAKKDALSGSELDQAERNLLAIKSALTTRKNSLGLLKAKKNRMAASLALSKAQLERTKLNLSKTMIVAPDDGVIVREMVQEGDFVRAGDQLVMFEDTSRSEVICNLTPSDLNWIRDNAPSSTEFVDGNPSEESLSVYHIPKTSVAVTEVAEPSAIQQEFPVWEGILERFDGIGRDESTRTIPCRITIKKPVVKTAGGQQRALVRGMYVKCRIEVPTSANDSERQFLQFPARALQPGNYVWVVEEMEIDKKDDEDKGRLRKVQVDVVDYTIDANNTKIVLVSTAEGSLQSGDMVVDSPISQPSEEAVVIVIEDESEEALD